MNVHKLIARIGSDPKLLEQLLSKSDQKDRKAILVSSGLLTTGEVGPNQKEIEAEIVKMISPATSAPRVDASGQRVVEWVGAVATAAAGAAAAACSGDA